MTTPYVGSRFTLNQFVQNGINYLNGFNSGTIQALANMSFTSAPINGGTEIQAASITGDRLVDGTIPSSKLAPLTSLPALANDTYFLGTLAGGGSANLV